VRPPIVIYENWDISIHVSPAQAESFLEPVDVRDGIYVGYDSEGYLLDLSTGMKNKIHHFLCFRWEERYEVVLIHDHEPKENRANELRTRLIDYLKYKYPNEEFNKMTLEDLIQNVGRFMPWKV
jgi:hypothetical protein